MKLSLITPAKSLNKAYLRQSLKRDQIELFKANLARMFERIRATPRNSKPKSTASSTPSTA